MPHTAEEKKRALMRVHRIRGQLDALERALDAGSECGPVLQQIAAVRGAINGLMASVLESHLRAELAAHPEQANRTPRQSIDDIVSIVHSYLK